MGCAMCSELIKATQIIFTAFALNWHPCQASAGTIHECDYQRDEPITISCSGESEEIKITSAFIGTSSGWVPGLPCPDNDARCHENITEPSEQCDGHTSCSLSKSIIARDIGRLCYRTNYISLTYTCQTGQGSKESQSTQQTQTVIETVKSTTPESVTNENHQSERTDGPVSDKQERLYLLIAVAVLSFLLILTVVVFSCIVVRQRRMLSRRNPPQQEQVETNRGLDPDRRVNESVYDEITQDTAKPSDVNVYLHPLGDQVPATQSQRLQVRKTKLIGSDV